MKRHLVILFGYTLFFTCSEIIYRYFFNIPHLIRIAETAGFIFIVVMLYYFSKYRITRLFSIIFFALSTIVNNVHYEVYDEWINSTNYLLMITEFSEVTTAGITMLDKIIPVVLWGIFETIVFISIGKFRTKTTFWADIIFISIFIYMFIRSFVTDNYMGLMPRTYYSRIKSNIFSFSDFIGKTLPYEIFKLSDLPSYLHPKPNIISPPRVKNIIFIVGESVSAKHIHRFGYPRKTTPFLDEFVNKYPNTVFKPAYSAGLATAISLPALFNAVPYPNGLIQMVRGDTNLFQLAQGQGFKTSFHSSQPEWEMEILGTMGRKWIDDITFPTQLGFSVKSGMNDHKVLPYLYQTDFSQGQNFFILHQRGSHIPYAKYLDLEEKHFKADTPLDNYDSTVYDTDLYIKKVFEFLSQQKTDDWLLIYTSDHGQNVTNEVYNQGTVVENSYLVPLMIYTPNKVLQAEIYQRFEQCNRMFHQQLSTLLISLLGYDMPISGCQSGVINSNLLTGNSGYLKVEKDQIKFFYPNSDLIYK